MKRRRRVDPTDRIITNPMLRAQIGSLSKWSISTAFSYNAGSVEKPLDPIRPNITGSNQNQTALQSLGGSIGVRYRLNSLDALSLSGGLRIMTPLQNSYSASSQANQQMFDESHGKFDFNNPTLAYTHVFALGSTQNYVSLSQTYTTDPGLRTVGYLTNTGIGHTIAYTVGSSGVTLEFYSAASFYVFDKTPPNSASLQTTYEIDFSPIVEYRLNRIFNLRTQWGLSFEHLRSLSGAFDFKSDRIYQSLGIGISVTRDIFLFPNIQFLPDEIRADKTNLALSTNINFF